MPSHWIRDTTRWTLYLRGDLCCVYCLKNAMPVTATNINGGAILSLDHLHPRILGGSNLPDNLVVACIDCNVSKQQRSLVDFLDELEWNGTDVRKLRRRINRQRLADPKPFRAKAKAMIAAPPPWMDQMRRAASNIYRREKLMLFT